MLPVKRFNDFIEQNCLFNHSSNLLAAVSGGMDSVLMVHLLKAAGYTFGIAHCNFQLRGGEALADQLFCKQMAEQLQVPFYTVNFDTQAHADENKVSIQMAARALRYQWFEQVRQQSGYDVIALAHHQNDTIETILLNLTRGTGIAGLHGILPRNGRLVRPLLFLSREEIENVITEDRISYVEDSSNASVKYARNLLRHEVIPQLKALNPNLENTFEHNLKHFRDLELLLQQRLNELKKDLFVIEGDEIHLSLEKIRQLEPKSLLLFGLLQEYGFNETTVNDLIASLDKHPGRVFEGLSSTLILDRDQLILKPKQALALQAATINPADHETVYGTYKLFMLHDDTPLIVKDNPYAVSIDTDLLVFPLTIRPWQQSDRFYPLGMKTQKKLSDFFINQKIPLHQKQEIPILVNGNGEIIWIGGYRPDERYKVSDKTKKVTIFELYK